MRTSSVVHCPRPFFLPKYSFPVTTRFVDARTPLSFTAKVECFQGKLVTEIAESELKNGPLSVNPVSSTLLIAEKEEAKAVLILFLKQQGLSSTAAARTIKKSDVFVEHLVSRLHLLHKYPGRELTTIEIREAITPYLEALLGEYGESLVGMIEHFPNPPPEVKSTVRSTPSLKLDLDPQKPPGTRMASSRPRAIARVSDTVPADKLPQHVIYLVELGLDLDKIQVMTRKFPNFAYYSLEGKVKPLVEFLLELGVPKSGIPNILFKMPRLVGFSLSENLIPKMKFLEDLGVDKRKWAKMISRFPSVLTYSRQKINSQISFLQEMGLSDETIGKVITRFPPILGCSVEDKLCPAAEYFMSMGIDVSHLLHRWPEIFGLSIEGSLKQVVEFFLDQGFSKEEVAIMIQRFGAIYTLSFSGNLLPTWEFFLSMGYPRSGLVKFPPYFGYSLDGRIKPRYALMRLCGVKLSLSRLLAMSDVDLDKTLKRKMKQMGLSDN